MIYSEKVALRVEEKLKESLKEIFYKSGDLLN